MTLLKKMLAEYWFITALALITVVFLFCTGCATKTKYQMFKVQDSTLIPHLAMSLTADRPVYWIDTNGCSWSVFRGKTNGPICPNPVSWIKVAASYPCVIQGSTNLVSWQDMAWGYELTVKPTNAVLAFRGKVEPVFVLCYGYSSGVYDHTASTTAKSITVPSIGSRTVYGRVYAYFAQSMRESPLSAEMSVKPATTAATFNWQYNGPILAITKG
jgi:hypothetical protein